MRNRNFKDVFKKSLLLMAVIFSASTLKAQLTGVRTIPGDYATISAFVTDANTVGIGAGGVVVNVTAGHTETSTAVIALTATGTAANPILIQKSGLGANPIITSYTAGTGTPGSASQDGIFALVGSDYVTIDGIDLTENAANTTNPSTMEYGYGMFKASATDGCQFNVIRNCTVTLSNVNNAGGSGPSFDGSRGINLTNALITAQTTAVTVTDALGTNSNNQIYSNTISNVNIGIALAGFAAATPFTLGDTGNDVGGASLLTGNTIINFGGAAAATNPAAGIRTVNQWSPNISYNTVNNNNGAGVNHVSTLRGILIGGATSANTTVNNNIITLQSGATTSLLEGISNAAGATAAGNTTNINNNSLFVAYSTATTGSVNGIANTAAAATVNINGNTISNIAALPVLQNVISGTGTVLFITGGSPTNLNINTNTITTFARTSIAGGTTRGIVFASPTNTIISGNTIENIAYSAPSSTGNIDGIYGLSSSVNVSITNNIVRNLSTPTTGIINGIREWGVAGTKIITGNQVYGFATTSGGAGGATFNGIFTSTGTVTVQNNTIYNLVSTGSTGGTGGTVYGYQSNGSTATTVLANKIYDLASNSTNPVVAGVHLSAGTTNTVTNNLIGDLRAPFANAANAVVGINVTGGTTTNVYYNTVRLTAASAGANFGSSAISAATSTNLTMNNNIFVNSSSANGTGLAVAYRRSSATLTSYQATSDRNDFVASTIYTDGTTPLAALAAYQAAMAPRDANSISEVPNFISTTGSNANFLHINTTLPSGIESGGVNIGGITTDFDNDIRQGNGGYAGTGTAPDMGADEFETSVVNCSVANGGTISPATNTNCEGTTRTITSVGATNEFGNSYQWKVSTTAGGPYVNVTGGIGATTTSYTTAALTPGTYYYVLETTCSFGPLTGLSNEYTLVVNPTPLVAVTPSSATYCNPGTPVSLTASGASSYAWSPATGLSAITGATVNASPSVTTTYTVLGSDLGCPSLPVNVTVTVVNAPVISSVTATPPSVCSGGSSQLQVNVNAANVNEYLFTAGTGSTLDPMVGATTVINSANDDTPTAAPANIGFSFPFNGTTYTQYSVSPDGWLSLGGATATASFTNQVTLATNTPKLYPLWDDLATGTTGNVQTLVTGTAPNQIFIVQWSVTVPRNTTGPANSTFQAWLYESTGVVEFRYGTIGVATGTMSAGLTGSATNYNSVTYSTNTASAVVANDNNTVVPASGTIYTFTPPVYTYAWSPATFLNSTTISNPLATGVTSTTTYNVTAFSGACPSVASPVTITSGSALTSSATITPSNTVCAGTAVTISATGIGGGAPYTYAWTGPNGFISTSENNPIAAASATDAGLYTVTVTDNCGATSISTVTLTVNALPIVTATPPTSLYCAPGTGITLTASGASNYTWSPAAGLSATTGATVIATPSANTTYTVTGTDGNGCTATATAIVNSSAAITSVTATALPTATCDGNSVLTATAAFPALSYCQPVYSNGTGFGDFISSVQLNTLNNTSVGAAAPYYTLYPTAGSTTTTLTAGSTYTITLSAGTYTQNDLAAWIDFNQNGTLNDATEKLGETNNLGAAPATTSFTFTVPLTASNGTTRLRVRDMDYGSTGIMDPCAAQSSFGETEDYTITIVGGVDPYTVTWSPATYLSSTSGLSVSASGIAADITYTATATTAAGCTNSNTATITILAPSSSTTTVTDCDTYTWTNGTTYTTSGTYTQVLTNAVGCDSTATLNLIINNSTTSTTTVSACDSYTWTNSTTYTASGTYTQVLTNAVGCDSTATLVLTINNSTTSSTPVTACDSYTWTNGTTYTVGGTYTQVLTNAAGCDSTATLVLTINNSSASTTTVTECDSYTWTNGTTYTASGTYTQVLTNAASCDSTATLVLTINNSTASTTTVTECDSYTWTNATTYTVSGTYTQLLTNAIGCDSTATLVLTINNSTTGTDVQTACDSYTWIDGVTYTANNSTATFVLTNAAGCDSLVTLNLTITTSPTAVATDNGDATITASAGTSYQWIDCGTGLPIAGATSQTYTVTANGSYAVVVDNGACDDTSACVVIDYIGIKEVSQDVISVFPNPTRDFVTVNMTAANATIEVVDAQGKILQTSTVENGGTLSLASYETGMYIFRITTENGTSIHRISKN